MTTCARCRAEVGDARHCPRCGQAVLSPQGGASPPLDDGTDTDTDTAERPAVRAPVEPPPAAAPPVPARYALFADEAVGSDTAVQADVSPSVTPAAPVGRFEPDEDDDRSGAPGWLLWAVVALVLVLIAAGGVWLLLSPGDDPTGVATSAGPTRSSVRDARSDATRSTPSAEPSTTPKSTATPTAAPVGDPVDVAPQALAQAPRSAPANVDLAGNRTTYVAANLLDGRADTCWRMPGDGTGTELTFTLAGPTTLNRVGLVNGYAKTAVAGGRTLNWYVGNRRVYTVTWTFDDGSRVDQPLTATKQVQTLDISPVTTSTVRLRLVSVSAPGTGRSARDYTAVSEVTLVGLPSV